jgi:hypothetical protein
MEGGPLAIKNLPCPSLLWAKRGMGGHYTPISSNNEVLKK